MLAPKGNARRAPGAQTESTLAKNDAPERSGLQLAMQCPKWESCSAPICPLIDSGTHRGGERTCLWLRELAKPGGRRALRLSLPLELCRAVERAAPAILARHASLRIAVERSRKSPSKLRRPGARRAA